MTGARSGWRSVIGTRHVDRLDSHINFCSSARAGRGRCDSDGRADLRRVTMELLILAVLIGLVPAIIASNKGYSFGGW